MAPNLVVVVFGFLLVTTTLLVQSAPIEIANENDATPSKKPVDDTGLSGKSDPVQTVSTTAATETNLTGTTSSESASITSAQLPKKHDDKRKRSVNELVRLSALAAHENLADKENNQDGSYQVPYLNFGEDDDDDDVDRTLHALTQETSATVHDKTNKLADQDDSSVFTDVKMTPSELTNVVHERHRLKLNDGPNRRRKRALSAYDLYDSDPFYEPLTDLIEREYYVRPSRAYAPLYWYPSLYERKARSTPVYPNYMESGNWYDTYPETNADDDDDDVDEDPIQVAMYDPETVAENDYEVNRYPILLKSSRYPFDNLQQQQQYNVEDLQFEDEPDDEYNDEFIAPVFLSGNTIDVNDDGDDEEVDQRARQYYPFLID